MTTFTGRRPGVLMALMAIAIATMTAGCGDDDTALQPGATHSSGFTLTSLDPDGPERGVAYLTQDDERLRGWIVVWGLQPGSAHASHLHANASGRAASCDGRQTSRHAVDFEELVADSNGVATHEVDILVGERVVRSGTYWMVHAHGEHDQHHDPEGGSAVENPGLLCGDIVPEEGPA